METKKVWIAYSKEPPYLPVAIADTAEELAKSIGTTKNAIESAYSHYRRGRSKTTQFHRVEIG